MNSCLANTFKQAPSLSLFSIPGFSSFQLYILPMFYKYSLKKKKKKVIVKQEENASGH